jgi:SCY1-like protein 2
MFKQDVSVFVFEKKIADKIHKPGRREKVAEVLRKEVSQLSRLKHPKILKVIHPLEETKYVFVANLIIYFDI